MDSEPPSPSEAMLSPVISDEFCVNVKVGDVLSDTLAGVSNKRKLSIPHSSLFPSEYTRMRKSIVEPVPLIVFVNSPKASVNIVPSPHPLLSVSSYKFFQTSPVPLALPLL